MDLALDPMTGNRYLYAGANPVGLIDDGHGPGCGRLGKHGSPEWQRCANKWVPLKKQLIRQGVCGECAAAYALFNARYPQFGLGAGVLRSSAQCKKSGGIISTNSRRCILGNGMSVNFSTSWRPQGIPVNQDLDLFGAARRALGRFAQSVCGNGVVKGGLTELSRHGTAYSTGAGFIFGGPPGGATGLALGPFVQGGAMGLRLGCEAVS